MHVKVWIIKTAINMTPNFVISSVSNLILKGIAQFSDFSFDLETRTVYLQVLLAGEQEAIELSVDGFAIIGEPKSRKFIIQKTNSNKLWLNNILKHIVGRALPIPDLPNYRSQIELLAELLKTEMAE